MALNWEYMKKKKEAVEAARAKRPSIPFEERRRQTDESMGGTPRPETTQEKPSDDKQ